MRPANLVVIMSDEHHPRAMGIAGHAFVVTPNLDRLARRGTRFDAATCNSPICVPSRASFATGRYVHELGTWDNAIAYDGSVPGWGHALQRTRHRVDSIGKLHYRNTEDPVGFDHQYHPMHIYGGHGMVWGALRDGSTDFSDRAYAMLDPIGPGTSKYNIYDDRIASEAERWIERAAGERSERPWVLFVGFVAPHFPLTVPEEILKLYPTASMPLPRLHPNRGHPRHPWLEASHRIHPVDDGLDEQRRRLATACYYGLCTWVDRQVGRVIDALDRSGLSDTTRIIYTSDHGDNIGARGIWGKSTHYEDAVGVPMIVAGPDVTRGHVCRTPVSLVDLAPTILDAVGEDPYGWAENLPGRSLLEIGEQPDDATRTVFSEYHAFASPSAAFMLRNGRFKYNYYVGYPAELFDLAADPGEERNLADTAEHAPVVAQFEQKLRALLDPEATDARAKADQAALIARFGGPAAARNVGAPGATPAPI
ncbi:MAG TPA: sulfatase-like hydrolase/transferase [Hyphomicrobiaceae bacterium]|nr:sulfatase-like hydrolase/transferase [Hyphomicrobiaceae bacterium]